MAHLFSFNRFSLFAIFWWWFFAYINFTLYFLRCCVTYSHVISRKTSKTEMWATVTNCWFIRTSVFIAHCTTAGISFRCTRSIPWSGHRSWMIQSIWIVSNHCVVYDWPLHLKHFNHKFILLISHKLSNIEWFYFIDSAY